MKKYTDEEIKNLYNDYLDEIGRAGIENYSALLKNAYPIAYQVNLNNYISEKKYL